MLGAMDRPVALVFPPLWYYTSAPADLTHTAGVIAGRGAPVRSFDLSARLGRDLLGATDAWAALRRPDTYADPATREPLMRELSATEAAIAERHRVRYALRRLRFPDVDEGDVLAARRVGLSDRNPALPTLRRAVAEVVALAPSVVALALVYPEQRVQLLAFAALLRDAGYRGFVVAYGGLQDEIAPEDFVPDLVGAPRHRLFDHLDGVVVGDAGPALVALRAVALGEGRLDEVPNLVWARDAEPRAPERQLEDLADQPRLELTGLDPADYPTPEPVVDLRMGRGCPWGKCAFCAIQAHHPGYRAGPADRVAAAMVAAHAAWGTRFFRIRDDLVTPKQLGELSAAIGALPFAPRWTARARFQVGWTPELLARARSAGLDELWVGLESAVPRVRERMDKGVQQETVARNLADLHAAGIRTRLLCLLGFPGETEAEAHATVDFVLDHLELVATASLSPFELMRRSPMALEPGKFGLRLLGDPLPRFVRLRYEQRADWVGRLDATAFGRVAERARERVGERLLRELCPDATHGWRRAVS